jgi:hypothetical protein
LLSTPLTLCLVVLGRHVERLEFLDIVLGDQPALTPVESFYQRMLANEPDEAAHQAETFLKERPLSAYCDEIAIKGLALAQLDADRGSLGDERRVQIKDVVQEVIDDLAHHTDPSPPSAVDRDEVAGTTGLPARRPSSGLAGAGRAVHCRPRFAGRGDGRDAGTALGEAADRRAWCRARR